MTEGDPVRAKEIFEQADGEWFMRALVWRKETQNARRAT